MLWGCVALLHCFYLVSVIVSLDLSGFFLLGMGVICDEACGIGDIERMKRMMCFSVLMSLSPSFPLLCLVVQAMGLVGFWMLSFYS